MVKQYNIGCLKYITIIFYTTLFIKATAQLPATGIYILPA